MPRKEKSGVSLTPEKKSQQFMHLLKQLSSCQTENLRVLVTEMVKSNLACIRSIHTAL